MVRRLSTPIQPVKRQAIYKQCQLFFEHCIEDGAFGMSRFRWFVEAWQAARKNHSVVDRLATGVCNNANAMERLPCVLFVLG